MKVRLLGDVAVIADDPTGAARAAGVAGAAQRALLARLALDAGHPVSVARLADDLWDGAPPDAADRHLQVRASRLRRAIDEAVGVGAGAVVRFAAGGYVLDVPLSAVDLYAHADLVARAEAVEAPEALELLDRADALWAPPLEEFRLAGWATADSDRARRNDTRSRLRRATCLLESGQPARAVDLLHPLVAADPLGAAPAELLMRALWVDGDHAAALGVYRDLRERLVEQGLDPPDAVRLLEAAILQGESPTPTLTAARSVPAVTAPPVPTPDPRRPDRRVLGREDDVAAVVSVLASARLVTLWGPGGIGKTTLARAVVTELRARAATVAWVDLSGAEDPDRLADHVRVGLGLAQDDHPTAAIAGWARGRGVVVALDNAEHLAAGAPALGEVLDAAPSLRLLVTSRVPLRLADERVVEVAPLPAVVDGRAGPAVDLLREHGGRVAWPDDALARLADALDGVPLALELVRSRLPAITPDDLVLRLGTSLDLPRAPDPGGQRPDRQQSMRATLAWSHGLLDQDGRDALAAIGVCRGRLDLPLLEAIVPLRTDVLAGLADLAAHALVRPVDEGATTTYEAASAVRAFAQETLTDRDDASDFHDRHADHAVLLGRRAAADRTTAAQTAWLESLPARHDDLLAAHAHLRCSGRGAEAAQLLADVAWYWLAFELAADVLRLLPDGAALAALPELVQVQLAQAAALAHMARGELDAAADVLDGAVALGQADPVVRARLDVVRSELAIRRGFPATTLELADEAAAVLREHATAFDAADAVARSVIGAWHLGDRDDALRRTRRALRLHREAGSAWGIATLNNNLAYLLSLEGDLETAERLAVEALATLPGLRTTGARADVADTAAAVAMLRGDERLALERLEETRQLLGGVANRETLPLVLARMAQVHADRKDPAAAAAAAVEAAAVAREVGAPHGLLDAADGLAVALACAGHDDLAGALAATADGARQGSWEDGLSRTLRDARLHALGVVVDPAGGGSDDLSGLVEEALDLLDQP